MENLEYRSIDKSDWGSGPWQDEPDKVQFTDEATGFPCLIVRGPSGALCGYVGVDRTHPLFETEYSARIPVQNREELTVDKVSPVDIFLESFAEDDGCCSLSCILNVHGGVTFAGKCHSATHEDWLEWRTKALSRREEAEKFPMGDAARMLRERADQLNDFAAYQRYNETRAICHKVSEGEDDDVWWFGFDCAHHRDYSPRFDRDHRALGFGGFMDGEYRDIAYVREQIAGLAQGLRVAARLEFAVKQLVEAPLAIEGGSDATEC